MNVNSADALAILASVLNVLGREANQQTIAAMTANTTVHWLWFVIVFKYVDVTRTCSPW